MRDEVQMRDAAGAELPPAPRRPPGTGEAAAVRRSAALSQGVPTVSDAVIEVQGLSKLSLRNVGLTIRSGDRVALIGRTGEGKSVLLKCLLGLIRPEAGQVTILGVSVTDEPVVAQGLGVAFQSPGLFDNWSVADNLRVASRSLLEPAETRESLASVGLGAIDPASGVTRLSGGQQKRLALLRALLRGDRLVILDEPTSGLDPATSNAIATMLAAAFARTPRALLMVTHDFEAAAILCNRFMILDGEGSVTECKVQGDTRDEIITELRRRMDSTPPGVAAIPVQRPLPWGVMPLTVDFLRAGVPAAIIVMALMGAMLVAQTAAIESFIDLSSHIPEALVLSVFREMSPLIVGLLLASRIGTRVGAELAGMSYTSQLDSLRLLGLSPARLLLRPFLIAATIVFPLTITLGSAAALFAGALYSGLPTAGLSIGPHRFFDLAVDVFDPLLPISGVIKGGLMGAAVVLVAYLSGTRHVSSAQALGAAATRASSFAAIAVVTTDILISWIIFQ